MNDETNKEEMIENTSLDEENHAGVGVEGATSDTAVEGEENLYER